MTPRRTCVVCRNVDDQSALRRLARAGTGWSRGRGDGRGVWVHQRCAPQLSVADVARSLRQPVSAREVEEVVQQLVLENDYEVVKE